MDKSNWVAALEQDALENEENEFWTEDDAVKSSNGNGAKWLNKLDPEVDYNGTEDDNDYDEMLDKLWNS